MISPPTRRLRFYPSRKSGIIQGFFYQRINRLRTSSAASLVGWVFFD